MGKPHASAAWLRHNFSKVLPYVSEHVIAQADFCFGVSQPGEVSALDSFRAMDLLKGDKSNCSSGEQGFCYAKHCMRLCPTQE